jgi:hypothetical protein
MLSAKLIHTPCKNPRNKKYYLDHGESLKTRLIWDSLPCSHRSGTGTYTQPKSLVHTSSTYCLEIQFVNILPTTPHFPVCLFCSGFITYVLYTFRCVRKIQKSDYQLRNVSPSICSHGTTWLPIDGFCWNLIIEFFWKSVEKIQVSLKADKNNKDFTRRHFTFLIISR